MATTCKEENKAPMIQPDPCGFYIAVVTITQTNDVDSDCAMDGQATFFGHFSFSYNYET